MAVVVSYNPDIQLLSRNLDALVKQAAHVSVYDNASANPNDLRALVESYPTVSLVENGENLGLPIAYNRAMAEAASRGYEWLLTMDQDSVLPDGFIDAAAEYFDDPRIAILCPRRWNKGASTLEDVQKSAPKESVTFVESTISSGSLCRVSAHADVGGFDERMFIDYVDYDYCRTVIEHGYTILRINSCIMEHSIGKCEIVNAFGHRKEVFNHSAIRKYYFFRNRLYFARKHRYRIKEHKYFYQQFFVLLLLVLYEKEDVPRKFWMSLKGLFSGLTMKIDRKSARRIKEGA